MTLLKFLGNKDVWHGYVGSDRDGDRRLRRKEFPSPRSARTAPWKARDRVAWPSSEVKPGRVLNRGQTRMEALLCVEQTRMTKHGLSFIQIIQATAKVSLRQKCKPPFLLGRVDHWMVAKVMKVARGNQSIATIIACVGIRRCGQMCIRFANGSLHISWNMGMYPYEFWGRGQLLLCKQMYTERMYTSPNCGALPMMGGGVTTVMMGMLRDGCKRILYLGLQSQTRCCPRDIQRLSHMPQKAQQAPLADACVHVH